MKELNIVNQPNELSDPQFDKSKIELTEWLFGNNNRTPELYSTIPATTTLYGLRAHRKHRYGLINLSVGFDEFTYCGWSGSDLSGRIWEVKAPEQIDSFIFREQPNYGIVNVGFKSGKEEIWMTDNMNGKAYERKLNGLKLIGIQGGFQWNYGLVDVRLVLLKD